MGQPNADCKPETGGNTNALNANALTGKALASPPISVPVQINGADIQSADDNL